MRHLLLPCVLSLAACSGAGNAPRVFPSTIYLGVEDSGTKYSAPIAVGGASPMAYSVADNSVASAAAGDQQMEVGALRVGSTSIVMRNDFGEATANVSVAMYSASARETGQPTWNSFNCASCHTFGPDVTPSGIAGLTDAEIEAAVTSGMRPGGGEITPAHTFAVPSSEGMVAFLRSLPARGVPAP